MTRRRAAAMRLVAVAACLLSILPPLVEGRCVTDEELSRQILRNERIHKPDGRVVVSFSLRVTSLELIPESNRLRVEGNLLRKWTDTTLRFDERTACSPVLRIHPLPPHSWRPRLDLAHPHPHDAHVEIYPDGQVVLTQRINEDANCLTDVKGYPWGNTTCTLKWRNEKSRDHLEFRWDANANANTTILTPVTVGDMEVEHVDLAREDLPQAEGIFDELKLEILLRRKHNKVILLFFFPSVLFMIISWMSLILGPMAITRSVLNIGSLILLLIHFSTNMAGLPVTTGITAIELWKIIAVLYVLSILVELVIVSCMASTGRSRRLQNLVRRKRNNKRSQQYVLEPLYEELNDLRARKTRRTCSCCRYTALFCDCSSFIGYGILLVALVILYYFFAPCTVTFLNDFSIEDLKYIKNPLFYFMANE